jgi:hypothetical protein
MAKIPRSYRFEGTMLEQIEWLGKRLGHITDTDVLTIAVAELYHRRQSEEVARLRADGEAGYDLMIGNTRVLTVGEAAVRKLPEEQRLALLGEGAPSRNILSILILGAALAGEKIVEYPDALEALYAAGKVEGHS